MSVEQALKTAGQSAGFLVLNGFERYGYETYRDKLCLLVSDNGRELLQECKGTDGKTHTSVRQSVKAVAFAQPDMKASELNTAVELLENAIECSGELVAVAYKRSAIKNNSVQNRLCCEIELSATVLYETED